MKIFLTTVVEMHCCVMDQRDVRVGCYFWETDAMSLALILALSVPFFLPYPPRMTWLRFWWCCSTTETDCPRFLPKYSQQRSVPMQQVHPP